MSSLQSWHCLSTCRTQGVLCGRGCCHLLQGMEKGVKDFAQNVEQLVDRVVSGDLALELTQHADKMVSGFIRGFEVRSHACNCCAPFNSTAVRKHASAHAQAAKRQHGVWPSGRCSSLNIRQLQAGQRMQQQKWPANKHALVPLFPDCHCGSEGSLRLIVDTLSYAAPFSCTALQLCANSEAVRLLHDVLICMHNCRTATRSWSKPSRQPFSATCVQGSPSSSAS